MADSYDHPEDGKIHTRYTELCRCTYGQIDKVVTEHFNQNWRRLTTDSMEFGKVRHDMWEQESKKTGKLPFVFDLDWKVLEVEKEYASEMFPGVVVHSRIDSLCMDDDVLTIVDYKTLTAESITSGSLKAKKYRKSVQLPFYAYQLALHNKHVRQIAYLIEVWNLNRDAILGYCSIVRPVTLMEVMSMKKWAEGRAALLAAAIEEYDMGRIRS